MIIIKVRDYEELSKKAAQIVAQTVKENPDGVLGLATGSTPLGMYEELAEMVGRGELSFKYIKSINLDEYVGLSPDNEQSYRYFMRKNFFDKTDIDIRNTHLPDGLAKDIDAECRRYNKVIKTLGGPDIQVLGLGNNGHIGFNEPADSFPVGTHCVKLDESTIRANARFFADEDEVPRYAITMGIGSIMRARKILLLASGPEKSAILRRALFGEVTPRVPASALRLHPDVTVIGDTEALQAVLETHPEKVRAWAVCNSQR